MSTPTRLNPNRFHPQKSSLALRWAWPRAARHSLSTLVTPLLLVLMLSLALAGCSMTKRVTITTEPAGAELYLSRTDLLLNLDGRTTEPQFIGTSPLSKSLPFDENRIYTIEARKAQFENGVIDITHEPRDQRNFKIKLKRELVDLLLIDFNNTRTDNGVKLRADPQPTRAFLDTLERSPNIKSVTRVTNNQSPDIQIGGPVLSPVDNLIVYPTLTIEQQNAPRPYVVQNGDTIEQIAALFRTEPALIRSTNNLNANDNISPGQTLFISTQEVYSNIWKQSVGAFAKTRLTYGQWRDTFPAFSPDGKFLIFSSNRVSPNPTLWRIKLDGGGGITKITSTMSEDYGASIAGNGQFIAYASNPPSALEPQIWTVNVDGSLATQLHSGHSPQVSPTGSQILFVRHDTKLDVDQVWLMNLDGTSETQLTQNTDYDCNDPRWSPDGQWIVFTSNEAVDAKGKPNQDIWMMTIDGREKTQLTTNGSWDDKPCWDNTGKTIYFRSNRGGQWNIWRFDPILP